MPTKDIKASAATVSYWNMAKEIIDCVGKYLQADKLRANLEDESTAWKVKGVYHKYYDGNSAKLCQAILDSEEGFKRAVRKFNRRCEISGMTAVKRPDVLFELLKDEKRRQFYRRKIERRLQKDEIVPLQTLEKEYLAR